MGKARPEVVAKGKARRTSLGLDSGVLIAFEGTDAYFAMRSTQALDTGARVIIPAAVLGQCGGIHAPG